MSKNGYAIAGLDVGSAQTVVVIGRHNPVTGGLTLLGAGRAPCRGLKGGVVVNIMESKIAVAKAAEEAEEMAKETIQNFLVGIRGSHVETYNHRGAITISRTDKEITAEDVDNVTLNAKAIQLSSDREIIHTVPQDFSVDKQAGVEDPVGMEGSHLSVDVHIAVASSSHLSNIVKSINQAGFSCDDVIYGAYAVGDCAVSQEEKELGVALVDLGGQTTTLAVYADGSIRFTKEIPIGGELITKDISYGLKTSFTAAQTLKESYGLANVNFLENDETLEFMAVDGRTRREVKRRILVEIIQSRVEEIFEMVHQELQKSNYAEVIPGGLVLTGGGSKLAGIDRVAEEAFGMNVHLGNPIDVEGPPDILLDPTYTTAIGLLRYRHVGEWSRSHRSLRSPSILKKIKVWMDEVF